MSESDAAPAKPTIKISGDDLRKAREYMQGVEIIDKAGEVEIFIGGEEECVLGLGASNPLRPLIREYLIGKLKAFGIEPP